MSTFSTIFGSFVFFFKSAAHPKYPFTQTDLFSLQQHRYMSSKSLPLSYIYSYIHFSFCSTISSFYYQPDAVLLLTSSSGLNGYSDRQLCIHNISIVYISIYKSECAVQSYSLTRLALLALHSNKPQTSIVSLKQEHICDRISGPLFRHFKKNAFSNVLRWKSSFWEKLQCYTNKIQILLWVNRQ